MRILKHTYISQAYVKIRTKVLLPHRLVQWSVRQLLTDSNFSAWYTWLYIQLYWNQTVNLFRYIFIVCKLLVWINILWDYTTRISSEISRSRSAKFHTVLSLKLLRNFIEIRHKEFDEGMVEAYVRVKVFLVTELVTMATPTSRLQIFMEWSVTTLLGML
jgi:hypothetical protein